MADQNQAAVTREARRLAARLNERLPKRHSVSFRKGKVQFINDDGSVDIIIPEYPDPGDGTGHNYPRMHRLGSYIAPSVGDYVWFVDSGHGRYLCLGTEIGTSESVGAGAMALPKVPLAAFQVKHEFLGTDNEGAMSSPWYPRQGTDAVVVAGRISLSDLSVGDFTVSVLIDGVEELTMTVPAGVMTLPMPLDLEVVDGQSMICVVEATANDFTSASAVFDVQ